MKEMNGRGKCLSLPVTSYGPAFIYLGGESNNALPKNTTQCPRPRFKLGVYPGFFKEGGGGGVTLCQSESTHQIVMTFLATCCKLLL